MEILKIENTLRYITHTESPEHLCKGYPRSFEEKTPHNRRFITRLGNVRITAVCPCCSTEIFNKIEFKEVVYYSNLIGSRYEYNLDKWIPFNDEAPEYKKYQDLQKENIKEVVAVIDAEMDKLKNGIICPVCENHIAHDSETLSVRGDSLNSSEIGPLLNKKTRTVYWCHGEYENLRNVAIEFGKIKKEIKEKDEAEAKKKIKNLHKQCKAYRFEANNLIDTKIISKDVSNLREYLASIIKLESNERWLAERLEQLYLNEKEIERLAVREKSLKIKSKKEKVIIGEAECKKIVDQIKQLDGITMQQAGFILPPPPQKPNEPLYETPGFFNKKKVATENERKRFAYKNECTKYEQELEFF